ncbi:unnamed protein product [Larinioides sclopetarius]|uniref:Fatty acyl-CoA reductase n=1 Tax=Larinioides sclopetarius TaxID=280406 RepID=A0AAV2AM14_9ARAC
MFESTGEDKYFPRVPDFYDGKNVFLTGATGFVGAVLLETLLRCFPGIKSIYILVRSKKNVQPEIRKEQIFNKKIFEILKEETPEFPEKVHLIVGDISLPNLGMSEDDVQTLIQEVSIVFHCAAIISFTRPLEFTLRSNVLSLCSIIELSRKMKKFDVLVYTSTAYSNCNHLNFPLKEEIHRLPFPANQFIDALINQDNVKLEDLVGHCKPDWPNFYTFSKCLAENVIMDTASDLPIAIVRPSVVINTWKKPIPGYAEENSGIITLIVGAGKGFVKVFHADPNNKMNLVPVDIVSNAHVLAAWRVGTKRCASPFVVNCTATEKFNIKLCEINQILVELADQFPLPQSFEEHSRMIIVPNKFLCFICKAYYHYLPAVVLDGIIRILGKKPRIYSLYRFLDKVMNALDMFSFHCFEIERNNLEYLDKGIPEEDRKDLYLDSSDVIYTDMTLSLPQGSPFYDWKIDRKSQSERQKVKHRRHILIKSIQWTFLTICCLLIYWMFSFFFF